MIRMSQWAEIRHMHVVDGVPKREIARRLSSYTEKLAVVDRANASGLRARTSKAWGSPLVFGRLSSHRLRSRRPSEDAFGRRNLERRLDEKGVAVSWPDLMRDLAQAAFAASGVGPPSLATLLGPVPPPGEGGAEPEM